MKQKTEQEDLMVRYLFRELTEEEQSEIEERFLSDNSYFEQLCSVEDALIDDYVQGTLSDEERRKVQAFLLSSRYLAGEVEFTRNLVEDLSHKRRRISDASGQAQPKLSARSKILQTLAAFGTPKQRLSIAALFALIMFTISLAVWNLVLQGKISRLREGEAALEKRAQGLEERVEEQRQSTDQLTRDLEAERQKRSEVEQELADLQRSTVPPTANNIARITVTLDAFVRGSAQLPRIHIRSGIDWLSLTIELDPKDSYKSYHAKLETFEGREVWRRDDVSARQANGLRVALLIPAKLLTTGDYTLTIIGKTESGAMTDIGDYSFRVRR